MVHKRGRASQILSRASLPKLTRLDASATLECYILTRFAPLEKVPQYSNKNVKGDDASPSDIVVRKSALAFRHIRRSSYRASASNMNQNQALENNDDVHDDDDESPDSFELTLEYGPQRTGSNINREAMPQVVSSYNNANEGNSNNAEESDESYVTWENEGRIYYNTYIGHDDWETAHYMAPISGAVLSKVLDYALEYTFVKGTRYQPFEVVQLVRREGNDDIDNDNDNDSTNGRGDFDENNAEYDEILRIPSSSADDFVWSMMSALAKMYVNVKPIVVPPRRRIRLYISDEPEQVNASNEVSKMAARFYDHFFTCWHGRMSKVENGETGIDSLVPTVSPSISPSESIPSGMPISIISPASLTPTTGSDEMFKKGNSSRYTPSMSPSISPTLNESNSPSNAHSNVDYSGGRLLLVDDVKKTASNNNKDVNLYVEINQDFILPCLENGASELDRSTYLFDDGANYWKLNLTNPFMTASAVSETLPVPIPAVGKVQTIDWALAGLIVGGFLFGIIVMLQQMGMIRTRIKVNRYCGITSTYVGGEDSYANDTLGSRRSNRLDDDGVMMVTIKGAPSDEKDAAMFTALDIPRAERMLHTHTPFRHGPLIFGPSQYVDLPDLNSKTPIALPVGCEEVHSKSAAEEVANNRPEGEHDVKGLFAEDGKAGPPIDIILSTEEEDDYPMPQIS